MWAVEEILKRQRIQMQQTSHLPPYDTYKPLLLISFRPEWPENFIPILKPVRITLLFHLEPNFSSFWPFQWISAGRLISASIESTDKCKKNLPFQVLIAITWIEPPITVHLTLLVASATRPSSVLLFFCTSSFPVSSFLCKFS